MPSMANQPGHDSSDRMTDKPQDAEGVEYELHILQRMIAQLPGKPAKLLQDQLSKVIGALAERDKRLSQRLSAYKQVLGSELEDLQLCLKTLEFDLEATRRERDEALRRLDGQE